MTEPKRHSIAIVVPGGIGTGADNLGVPVLERQVKLLAKDFHVTVFSLFPVNAAYKPDNFSIVSIESRNPIIKSFSLWWNFRKHHQRKKFLAIHAFWILPSGFLAVVLGKLYGVKTVVSALGGDAVALPEINYGLLRRPIPRRLILWTMRHVDHPVALTKLPAENLQVSGLRRSIEVIPFGTDTDFFPFLERSFQEPIRFLHVGNLIPVKDQATLLRAFKIIRDQIPSHLTIIGEGPLENEMRRLIHELSLEHYVTLVAPMSHDQIPKYFKESDVLLHTSRAEGLPAIITEAMSAGLLVCGTSVGLIYDFPEFCVGVPVGDHHALATETLKLMKSPQRMKDMVRRAREWSEEHDIHWTVRRSKQMYLS